MKKQFIIFFSIVLSVYGMINFYIFFRGWHALAMVPAYRPWFLTVGIVLALLYPAGRFLERVSLSRFTEIIVYIGSLWLAEMVYVFLLTAAADIGRIFMYLFAPALYLQLNTVHAIGSIALVIIVVSTGMTVYGFFNAMYPRVKQLNLSVPRKQSSARELSLVVVSDIHLGTIMGSRRLRYIIDKINSQNADIVLLAGDVFDEDIGRVIKNNLGELLRQIRSTYGLYAITGNHEYIGGVDNAVRYLTEHGVTVLRDQYIEIADNITIIGREDRSIKGWSGQRRKSIPEILNGTPVNFPTILLDHQPQHLEEAVEAGIDIQFSGHTHHGQLWPFNFITKKVYEVSWGYKKKGTTHIYVSCGAGSWGPPVRTGNRPEIIHCRLTLT